MFAEIFALHVFKDCHTVAAGKASIESIRGETARAKTFFFFDVVVLIVVIGIHTVSAGTAIIDLLLLSLPILKQEIPIFVPLGLTFILLLLLHLVSKHLLLNLYLVGLECGLIHSIGILITQLLLHLLHALLTIATLLNVAETLTCMHVNGLLLDLLFCYLI